ncbi:UNVERIFIED_CONTAM: hypothetical protein PYX00_009716 [Menopon gallinae]|uniref:Uncharacterized protein n=1 Tax=Menopon gallinae TaxID=328185 RepID=A0AAW2HBZ6_9NEOP
MKDENLAEESFLEPPAELAKKPFPFLYIRILPEDLLERNRTLRILDPLATSFLFLVMYVSFWRGSFGIIHAAGFTLYQLGFLFFIGSFMVIYFMIMSGSYEKHLDEKTLSNAIFKTVYIYTTEMGLILHWAGLWFAMERIIGLQTLLLVYTSATSIVALFLMGSGLNTLSAPFKVICMNRKFVRRFRSKKSPEMHNCAIM